MDAEDIKALRKATNLTQRELAEALKVDVALVRDWETGAQFATKAHSEAMQRFTLAPPPKKPKRGASPMEQLADPAFFLLVRKLLTHAALRAACEKLATEYADPLAVEKPTP